MCEKYGSRTAFQGPFAVESRLGPGGSIPAAMPPHAPTQDPRFAQIESHRPYLLRYALAQLRDRQMAEEAVQEALLAALESVGSFGGKSSLRHPGSRPSCCGPAWRKTGSERAQSVANGLHCREASRLLSVAYERRLTAAELDELQRHLDRCFMCRNFDSQLKFLHDASERFRSGD